MQLPVHLTLKWAFSTEAEIHLEPLCLNDQQATETYLHQRINTTKRFSIFSSEWTRTNWLKKLNESVELSESNRTSLNSAESLSSWTKETGKSHKMSRKSGLTPIKRKDVSWYYEFTTASCKAAAASRLRRFKKWSRLTTNHANEL
jgi:hypothetical protein